MYIFPDKDDCENEPCEYGNCVDEINGFQCECNMFFKGKTCSKSKEILCKQTMIRCVFTFVD